MPDTTAIKGIEQGRAKTAYKFAENAKSRWRKETTGDNKDSKQAREYKSYVKKIPMMIKTNGLGGALAFVKSKCKAENNGNAYWLIYDQLTEWFSDADRKYLIGEFKANEDLVKKVIELDSTEYRAVAVETLALFGWIRRFAEGLIQGEADDNG
jgi:CRISPR-associated protein Cmr5